MVVPANTIAANGEGGGIMSLLPAFGLTCGALIFVGAVMHAPPPTGEMGVVFAPWISQAEAAGAIVAAGGQLVDSARLSNVMIAYGPDPAFAERVRERGAWFTVAARGLCAPPA